MARIIGIISWNFPIVWWEGGIVFSEIKLLKLWPLKYWDPEGVSWENSMGLGDIMRSCFCFSLGTGGLRFWIQMSPEGPQEVWLVRKLLASVQPGVSTNFCDPPVLVLYAVWFITWYLQNQLDFHWFAPTEPSGKTSSLSLYRKNLLPLLSLWVGFSIPLI